VLGRRLYPSRPHELTVTPPKNRVGISEKCRLKAFPFDAEMLCEQGLLRRDQKDLRGAEQSWLTLLDARRGQYFASEEVGLRGFRTRQLLAEVYRAQERFIEAEVQWRAALQERADFEPAWLGLGELYLRSERWSDLDYLLERLEGRGSPRRSSAGCGAVAISSGGNGPRPAGPSRASSPRAPQLCLLGCCSARCSCRKDAIGRPPSGHCAMS
jgi:hypothetical protein